MNNKIELKQIEVTVHMDGFAKLPQNLLDELDLQIGDKVEVSYISGLKETIGTSFQSLILTNCNNHASKCTLKVPEILFDQAGIPVDAELIVTVEDGAIIIEELEMADYYEDEAEEYFYCPSCEAKRKIGEIIDSLTE